MGAEETNPSPVPIDESAEGKKEPEKPIEGSAEGEKEPEKSIKKGSVEGEKESEKPIESKKGGWLGKALMFLEGRGVILLLVGVIIIFNLIGRDTKKNVKKIAPHFFESHFPLSSFLVPVSSTKQNERFVWIRIVLKLSKGDVEAIRSDLIGFRSTVFKVILHKKVEELMSYLGRNMLKREIQWKLNERLEGIEVQGIYFVDFLIL